MGSGEKKTQKKAKKKDNNRGDKSGGIEMISDDRFASAQSDPRFMEAPKRRSKVEIDSRFSRVFTDAGFANSNAPVDKRGKPRTKRKHERATASLKHFYRLQDEGKEKERQTKEAESESDESSEDEEDDAQTFDESASTSTTDSEDQFDDEEEEDTFLQPEANVPEIDKETGRLAVVNLDWSQVRAVDLYVLLSSFLPKGGQIMSVAVYPSEFGLKRMEEEAIHGPVGLFDDDEEHDDGDDDEIDNKKLRAYELSRLRYYYAVVECDSIATADYLYKTCDGVEFERSANKLDLRFIPDSLEFKHQPRDVATEAPADYEGLDFQTRALQHSNIHLTWDEDEPQRAKTLKRKLNDDQLAEMEMKEFLASDGSETDEEENADETEDVSLKKGKKRDKYRALIQPGDGSDDEGSDGNNNQDMEVTFSSGLEDISKRILEKKDKKLESVWDAYLRKRKEKKKASKSKYSSDDSGGSDSEQEHSEQPDDFFVEEPSDKGNKTRSMKKQKTDEETGKKEGIASQAELELLLTSDDVIKGYNLKPKKSKGKKGKATQDEGKIPSADYDDPRFSALFTSPFFALDPTDPQFKRSAAYARQLTQKNKMGEMGNDSRSEISVGDKASKSEISALVKSIKLKTNQARLPSKHKPRKGK